jgi:hypothetical protein
MEIRQQKETDATLFSVYNDARGLLFAIDSSTKTNQASLKLVLNLRPQITVRFRTKTQSIKIYRVNAPLSDGKWHKIIAAINGEQLQLIENCLNDFIKHIDFAVL